jgi:hypothetical protein
LGDEVVATINGQVVSWANNYNGLPSAPPSSSAPAPTTSAAPAAAPASSAASSAAPAVASGSSDWNRAFYYNSQSGENDGVVFLGSYGGQGSGVFDTNFGSSLAYLNSAGTAGCSSPETLSDTTVPSNKEFSIWTNQSCSDGSCGYARPGTVAQHGFGGADKIFVFEFSMPDDGDNSPPQGNMPALWLLNKAIAQTDQYGSCSCWPGCGEFDLFEILNSGNYRAKSTVHLNSGLDGGLSSWFQRPTGSTVKAAVIFSSSTNTANVVLLPDSTTFGPGFSNSDVSGFEALTNAIAGNTNAVFNFS